MSRKCPECRHEGPEEDFEEVIYDYEPSITPKVSPEIERIRQIMMEEDVYLKEAMEIWRKETGRYN